MDLMLTGNEFHSVCAATEKALVPTFVLTLGIKSGLELDMGHVIHIHMKQDIVINTLLDKHDLILLSS